LGDPAALSLRCCAGVEGIEKVLAHYSGEDER
jgi:hypothetical protein